jgi:hypothetical protein
VQEQLEAKKLTMHFICLDDQIADIFTKSLAKAHFQSLHVKLTVCSNQLSLRGHVRSDQMEISSDDDNGDVQQRRESVGDR